MRDRGRHPFFESLVFGLALILAAIVGYYFLRRVLKPAVPASPAATPASAPYSAPPDRDPDPRAASSEPGGPAASETEDSVESLPPVRITGEAPAHKPIAAEVPPPP